MFFLFLFFNLFLKFHEYNVDTYSEPFNQPSIALFQSFYSETIYNAKEEFEIASTLFPSVDFYYVNCNDSELFCHNHSIYESQVIKFVTSPHTIFYGEPIAFDIIGFIERNTNHKRNYTHTNYEYLDPSNFSDYVFSRSKSLIAFLDLKSRQSELVLPQIEELAFTFRNYQNFGVGYVDCRAYTDLCISNNVDDIPIIRAYDGKKSFDYLKERIFPKMLQFANEQFGTYFKSNGELNDEYGTIPSVFPLVEEFMTNPIKMPIIMKVKSIQNTNEYLKVMKRLLRNGEEILDNDINKYQRLIESAQKKSFKINQMKAHLNVLKVFKKVGKYVVSEDKDQEL